MDKIGDNSGDKNLYKELIVNNACKIENTLSQMEQWSILLGTMVNELKPFRSLKRRVANIFQKRNSLSDDSRGTSTQTIVNYMESEEERSIVNSDKRDSIHSDWSDLIPVNEEAEYGKIYKNRKEGN